MAVVAGERTSPTGIHRRGAVARHSHRTQSHGRSEISCRSLSIFAPLQRLSDITTARADSPQGPRPKPISQKENNHGESLCTCGTEYDGLRQVERVLRRTVRLDA